MDLCLLTALLVQFYSVNCRAVEVGKWVREKPLWCDEGVVQRSNNRRLFSTSRTREVQFGSNNVEEKLIKGNS